MFLRSSFSVDQVGISPILKVQDTLHGEVDTGLSHRYGGSERLTPSFTSSVSYFRVNDGFTSFVSPGRTYLHKKEVLVILLSELTKSFKVSSDPWSPLIP